MLFLHFDVKRHMKLTTVLYLLCTFLFFFSSRRRHTRLQGDWSSDVCSSDLVELRDDRVGHRGRAAEHDDLARPQRADALRRRVGDRVAVHQQHRGVLRGGRGRSEEHTSELQSPCNLVCRLLLEKKKHTSTHNETKTPPSTQPSNASTLTFILNNTPTYPYRTRTVTPSTAPVTATSYPSLSITRD